MCTAQTINQSIRVREGGSQTDREAVREAGRESGRQAGRQALREAIPVLVSDHLVHQAWREGIYSDRQASVHGAAHTINSPRDGSSDGYCFLLGMQGDVGGTVLLIAMVIKEVFALQISSVSTEQAGKL